ncbi:NAD(P)-dependent oxidoreductase [Nocardioides immobilis]|uniref:NAD(P)-dependent oxidoreductase n=1 Tax=Nocardioides immobilis TaxID=2049295 RepID=A0A417XTU0_9ACTN|nr:mycofactocin-coupled SDR family oxidoreductase [Nocardioides immobilis]RHW23746.1 NAD(P)-dependent oxidoreductase [Nocardioides immobilis]
MGKLDGRVALVTGAARGQGRSHAHALAAEGAHVALVDICEQIATVPYGMATEDDLARTHMELEEHGSKVWSRKADMRDPDQIASAVEDVTAEFGAIDIAVVNHGIYSRGDFWTLSDDVWQDMIDVNLTSVWRVLKAVCPVMIEQRSGSIVVTASVNSVEANPGSAHYTAAKHGVLGLVRTAAVELGPHRVRINAIMPGFVDTPMTDWQGTYDQTSGHQGGTREEHEKNSHHWHVIDGLIEPGEISGTVVFLASDDARRVTGVGMPVDDGHLVLPGFNSTPSWSH